MPGTDNAVYLTFDDGPHPHITPWVLQQLEAHNAKATFFCIGENVERYPKTYQKIIDAGHSVGNHTHTHPDGWQTTSPDYLSDVQQAARLIQSPLFRPPYGKIKSAQAKGLAAAMGLQPTVVMWDVLAADWDQTMTPQQCFTNVTKNVSAGAIVVFHDSEKAEKNLVYALPLVLKFLTAQKFVLEKLPMR